MSNIANSSGVSLLAFCTSSNLIIFKTPSNDDRCAPLPCGGALNLAFPRAAKIRTQADYDAVRKNGKTKRGVFFRLSVLTVPNEDGKPLCSRCGIIVSRRVGNAVTRNRVKRRLRELYRQEQHFFIPGIWLVFIATSQAAHASLAELRGELHRLGGKLLPHLFS